MLRKLLSVVVMASLVAAPALTTAVRAGPQDGTSQAIAAWLKDHPPPGYLRHYLGDDRYKIAGHVWQVVSTETDTNFHLPTCPKMLRQSAGSVIGFASIGDAVEAGYEPDPACNPEASLSGAWGGMGGRYLTIANRTKRGIPLTLADGVSTVTLPPGWERFASSAHDLPKYGMHYTLDAFRPLRGSGMVFISTSTGGQTQQLEGVLNASKFNQGMNEFRNTMGSTSGKVDNSPGDFGRLLESSIENMQVRDAKVNGVRGVTITMHGVGTLTGTDTRSFLGARSGKVYSISDMNVGRSANPFWQTVRFR